MRVYYNEWEPFAAAWLRALIAAGHLPPGDVDERSITEVRASDFAGYGQCHFFAGIGGWPLALAWAGWPPDREVWTGSCPCQPFSVAGKGAGAQDERHLWPAFGRLLAECRPATVLGEQVASRDGRTWLTAVRADLEGMGYAVGAADLCAAGVGAPHIRQRLYWVADRASARCEGTEGAGAGGDDAGEGTCSIEPERSGAVVGLGYADESGLSRRRLQPGAEPGQRHPGTDVSHDGWATPDWLPCRDGKTRPTQPGLHPLAHGVPGRVGRLRGYGNAIVPQVAAAFIQAHLDTERGLT